MKKTTRILPGQKERVETGPVRFGDDWTGLFIRGDECATYAFYLNNLLNGESQLPDQAMLQKLLGMLQGTRE